MVRALPAAVILGGLLAGSIRFGLLAMIVTGALGTLLYFGLTVLFGAVPGEDLQHLRLAITNMTNRFRAAERPESSSGEAEQSLHPGLAGSDPS